MAGILGLISVVLCAVIVLFIVAFVITFVIVEKKKVNKHKKNINYQTEDKRYESEYIEDK